MAFNTAKHKYFLTLVLLAFACLQMAISGDPDILTDFVVPAFVFPRIPPPVVIDGKFFTYTGLRTLNGAPSPANFTVTKVAMAEFPALNGQSVSYAVLQYPAGSVNPPHTHPRAAELLYLVEGVLEVGFVDTTNKIFNQTLQTGDIFVFPKGLVHFQFNYDEKHPAMAISAFGSANAGTVSVPKSVFTTGIDDVILAKSFKTDVYTIEKIEAGLLS